MSVHPMGASHVDEVVDLLHEHLKLIPPACLSKEEIKQVMADPDWLTRLHYPESIEASGRTYMTLAGERNGRVTAAAQVLLPRNDNRAHLSWIVGRDDETALQDFARQLLQVLRDFGYRRVEADRNPFGIGWSGVPDCWPHVLNALRAVGFDDSERWQLYWISDAVPATRPPEGVQIHVDLHPHRRELELTMQGDSDKIGEAHVWLAPEHLGTLVKVGLADIEWIEIAEAHRRKGLGLVLLYECVRVGREYGAASFMLWAEADEEVDNVAMQRLAEKAGFFRGPFLYWLKYLEV